MMRRGQATAILFILALLAGCASVDSQIAHDLRFTLRDTQEIGYGTGHGASVTLLGKISDSKEIRKVVHGLKFGEESEPSSQEPFDRYLFFMNADKTMTTIRLDGARIQYQGKEYLMDNETRDHLNGYFH